MKILIVKTSSFGDIVHTFPSLTDICKSIQNIEIHWLLEPEYKSIASKHPNVKKTIDFPLRKWRKEPLKLISNISRLKKILREEKYDLAIDAQGLIKTAWLRFILDCPFVGYDKFSIKEKVASFFYHKKISVSRKKHAISRTRNLMALSLKYQIVEEDIEYGLQEKNEESNRILFVIGTSWQSKIYPLKYWKDLAKVAVKNGYKVVVSYHSDKEKKMAESLSSVDKDAISLLPKMNLEGIFNYLSTVKGVFAVDTGIAHLASALSLPCVIIYGATSAKLTGAIGKKTYNVSANYHCSPCFKKKCNKIDAKNKTPPCYDSLRVEDIFSLLQK
jgi:heptosyltransferase-1